MEPDPPATGRAESAGTDPAFDPATGGVHTAETHISVLFFVGDRVYKLKKPVAMPFLDFTSREVREEVCRREVELNRRLAPDVYLGVATVLDTEGDVCDHLVVMRRMPEGRRLAKLVRDGADVTGDLQSLARLLAGFHASAQTAPTIPDAAGADSVLATWNDSFGEMEPFVGPVIPREEFDRVVELASSYVEGRRRLFGDRIADGHVRDGHGDLLADDIFFLDDGPRVLDCIEFDDRLRHGDVLADVSFLVMDLERLGRPDLGARFLACYEEFSGDRHPATLAEHYVAARAHVRSKVACLRSSQGHEPSRAEARRLHAMTLDHLERAQVPLVVVGGAPGTGKSTLATALGERFDWAVLRSDEIRKQLAGVAPSAAAPADFREGLYTPERTDDTYTALVEQARRLLELGRPVVLDASWSSAPHRRRARDAASAAQSPVVELSLEAPPDEVAARVERRGSTADVVSDATPEIARAMAEDRDPWPDAVTIDARRAPREVEDAAVEGIERALGPGSAGPG